MKRSRRIRLAGAPPGTALRDLCVQWLRDQDQEAELTARDHVVACLRGERIAGVAVLSQVPVLQAHFDRDGTAPRTMSAWRALEAGLDFGGIDPLVLVRDPGPLTGEAARWLAPAKPGYGLYRMRRPFEDDDGETEG